MYRSFFMLCLFLLGGTATHAQINPPTNILNTYTYSPYARTGNPELSGYLLTDPYITRSVHAADARAFRSDRVKLAVSYQPEQTELYYYNPYYGCQFYPCVTPAYVQPMAVGEKPVLQPQFVVSGTFYLPSVRFEPVFYSSVQYYSFQTAMPIGLNATTGIRLLDNAGTPVPVDRLRQNGLVATTGVALRLTDKVHTGLRLERGSFESDGLHTHNTLAGGIVGEYNDLSIPVSESFYRNQNRGESYLDASLSFLVDLNNSEWHLSGGYRNGSGTADASTSYLGRTFSSRTFYTNGINADKWVLAGMYTRFLSGLWSLSVLADGEFQNQPGDLQTVSNGLDSYVRFRDNMHLYSRNEWVSVSDYNTLNTVVSYHSALMLRYRGKQTPLLFGVFRTRQQQELTEKYMSTTHSTETLRATDASGQTVETSQYTMNQFGRSTGFTLREAGWGIPLIAKISVGNRFTIDGRAMMVYSTLRRQVHHESYTSFDKKEYREFTFSLGLNTRITNEVSLNVYGTPYAHYKYPNALYNEDNTHFQASVLIRIP